MSPSEPQEGGRLGRYRLVRKLAQGGMAEVYLAEVEGAAGFQKTLVIKRLLPHVSEDPVSREMFLNEARLASKLSHPNIVSILDLGEQEGQHFIAMEYIEGETLRALIRKFKATGQPIPQWHAVRIAALVAEGLHYAHEATGTEGVPLALVHRDISPDNILVSTQGAVKVVDFGIAKVADQPSFTNPGFARGKLAYMSPEQLRAARLDRRSDVFALAGVLYELLAGTSPFARRSRDEVAAAILNEAPTPLVSLRSDVDPAIAAAIDRALVKDREKRTPSCAVFQNELEAVLNLRGGPPSNQEIAGLLLTWEVVSGPRLEAAQDHIHPRTEVELVVSERDATTAPEVALGAEGRSRAPTRSDRGAATRVGPMASPTAAEPAIRGRGFPFGRAAVAAAAVALTLGMWTTRHAPQAPEVQQPSPAPPLEAAVSVPTPVLDAPVPPSAPPVPAPLGSPPVTSSPAAERPLVRARPVVTHRETGTLALRVFPWARVEVDGTFKGITPLEPISLSVGRHQVVLSNQKLNTRKERDVVVQEGATTALKVSMADPD